MTGRILIVDDDRRMREMLEIGLAKRGFGTAALASGEEAVHAVAREPFDAAVADVRLRGMSGVELCRLLACERHELPVVVMTAFGSVETAVAALRASAFDFLAKPFDLDELAAILGRAVDHRRAPAGAADPGAIVGISPAMARLRELVQRLAATDATVLVVGESGTGKELVARGLHRASPRRDRRFVAVNCAALPDALVESELFGHARGAFTGAASDHPGLFVQAHGGTLFLDEIGELPLAAQAKLLRVLDDPSVRPVGGRAATSVDVRIVAATNRDLDSAVQAGRFRADLLFRLDVCRVELPPLRSRPEDVGVLAEHFMVRLCAEAGRPNLELAPEVLPLLSGQPWPGNSRELLNCLRRAVALAAGPRITVAELHGRITEEPVPSPALVSGGPTPTLAEVERRHILRVLADVRGNRVAAARLLGIGRKTLYRKLRAYSRGSS